MKKVFLLLFLVSLAFSATSIFQEFSLTTAIPSWTGHGFSISLSLIKNNVAYVKVPQYSNLNKVTKGSVFGPFTVLDVTANTATFRYENVPKDLKSVVNRAVASWIKDQKLNKDQVVISVLSRPLKGPIIYSAFYRKKTSVNLLKTTATFQNCLGKSFSLVPSGDSFIAARQPGNYQC